MRKGIAVTVALLCLFSVPAFAEAPPNYVALKLGGYFPQSSDLDDFSNGVDLELAFGHYLSKNLALELSLGYFKTDFDGADFVPPIGAITESDEVKVYPLVLGVKGVHRIGQAEIFGGLGLGAYFTKAEATLTVGGSAASDSDSDTAVGFNVSAGATYDISPNLYVGAEAKYFWAKAEWQGNFFGVPVALDSKLDGITLTANLGYRF